MGTRLYTEHKEIKLIQKQSIIALYFEFLWGIWKCKLHFISPFLHGKDMMVVKRF